ncbi:hypothetical protein, partial [Parageobacillus thermoglucosidasius]|uniref:hypothetical protein n=1 Tax=Parageobacillus thermoglucosidasius TaxID=1426 RepID=UPI00242C4699
LAGWRQGVAAVAPRGSARARVPPRGTPSGTSPGTPTYSEQIFIGIKERGTPHDRPAQPYPATPYVLTSP